MNFKQYLELVDLIKRSDLTTISNARDLMSMAWNMRNDFHENELAFKHITQFIKEHWLEWMIESHNTEFEDVYFQALLFEAPYLVDSFFRYIEIDDKRKFYTPRATYLKPIIRAYQELYDGKLDLLSVSQPKRTGKTSSALRLCAMFSGRHPEYGTLASGHGEGLVSVFYSGILNIFENKRFREVFPEARVVRTQADKMNIDLQTRKMFPTIQCRPIDGSIVGSTEARNLLYLDDTVKNHEEAVNRSRLDFLCEKVTGDVLGRRIPDVTPILIQGTKYSIYDPISKLQEKARDLGWKWKEVAIPALDPITDESNFEFVDEGKRLFTTEAYRKERKLVTPEVWAAEFQQEPYEAKGRMFPEDKLNRYIKLPVDIDPDYIVGAVDTAESGKDSTVLVVGYVYGNDVFIEDVVYDNSPSNVTKPEVAECIIRNKVTSVLFESNAAGSYYGRDVEEILEGKDYRCSVRFKRSIANKLARIDEASSRIIKNFYFKERTQYEGGSQYAMFLREVTTLTRSGKVPHDDAPDALSILEAFIRDLHSNVAKIMSREELGI
jgi:predicted phage terminase large subunit-like protein